LADHEWRLTGSISALDFLQMAGAETGVDNTIREVSGKFLDYRLRTARYLALSRLELGHLKSSASA
jgi:hypothetical protein